MSDIKLVDANSLRTGGYMIIDGIACVIKRIDTSKTGKHGHSKCRIEASGVIDNQKKIVIKTSHDKVEVPIIEKKNAQVLSVAGDKANVMDSETFETFDLIIDEEIRGSVKEGQQVTYWIIQGQRILREAK